MTERDIFFAALDLPDPTARAAFLDTTCGGDPTLREKVESLLRSHAELGDFLSTPAVARPVPGHHASRLPPSAPVPGGSGGLDPEDELRPFLSPPCRPDSLGRIGHYEVLEVLGRGGFGVVFRAFDDVLQRVVAVKVLAPLRAATSTARKRFLREARMAARVRHENVVQVYEVGENPLPYLVMEFVPGETLQQRLDRTGPLDVLMALRIGRQVAAGLAAAHATGLIHRDIKPANVLLEGGQLGVKITDFGLARAADDAGISRTGVIAGTPMFMAPEQALGRPIDQRADLFSLGSVLYQMVAGRPPFRASAALAVLRRVAEDTPRPIREIIPATPDWLCSIIAKLHTKEPGGRFQSAREVADLLADCEAQLETHSGLTDFTRIPGGRHRPTRWWKWLAAAAVLPPLLAMAATEPAGMARLLRGKQPPPVPPTAGGESGPAPVTPPEALPQVRPPEVQAPAPQPKPPAPPPWTVLKPVEMKSAGGATLTPQADGSILVSGEHPDRDSYTLVFRNLPGTVRSLRLEVLSHDALPNKGPGRDPAGEFTLTSINARLALPAEPGQPRALKMARAWADNSRGVDSLVKFAIDEDDNTGWVTEVGNPHYAVFELAEPVAPAGGAVLYVTLEFKHEIPQLELGCFRLSVAGGVGTKQAELGN